MAILAIAAGMLLAWPYQALVTWVPYIYINLVVYVVFAGLLGGAAYLASALGKNRNRWLGIALGIVIATSAAGASHYFAYQRALDNVVEELASSDASAEQVAEVASVLTFDRYVDLRVEVGWSLGRRSSDGAGDLTGPFVWAIWVVELLGLIGAGIYGGMRVAPYCERCNVTLDEEPMFVRDDLDLADLGVLMQAPSAATLIDIPPRPPSDAPPSGLRFVYALHACKTCSGAAYLTVTQHTTASDGEDQTEELYTQVSLSPAEVDQLRVLQRQLVA